MDISVVIPLYNEAESLPELFSWIERVMKEHNYTYEVIFVNDGSTDNSWEVIEELKQRSPHVRGISSVATTVSRRDCIADSNGLKVTWSLPWTPICRTARMRYPNFTG